MFKLCGVFSSDGYSYELNENIQKLEENAKETLANFEGINQFNVKFLVIVHVEQNKNSFGFLNHLDASLFKNFNFVFVTFIKQDTNEKIWYAAGDSESVEKFGFLRWHYRAKLQVRWMNSSS